MPTAFQARLRAFTALSEGEIGDVTALAADTVTLRGERMLLSEGDEPRRVHILTEGWAARVKTMPDGRRHLCSLLVPGDICDVDGLLLRAYDYGVVALTPCTCATADRRAVVALCEDSPRIAAVLAWLGYVDNALLNEAVTSLALRSARQRLAHLLCELRHRLDVIGAAADGGYDLPLSQDKLADALGLTAVHTNRTIKVLREEGLLELTKVRVSAADWRALEAVAQFSPAYLHLDGMRTV